MLPPEVLTFRPSPIINYDLPENFDDFVHRVGRTGRVGRQGWATSLYSTSGPYANTKILGGLLGLLEGNGQEIPAFLKREAAMHGVNSQKGGGKKRFGGMDARGGKSWSATVGGFGIKRGGGPSGPPGKKTKKMCPKFMLIGSCKWGAECYDSHG